MKSENEHLAEEPLEEPEDAFDLAEEEFESLRARVAELEAEVAEARNEALRSAAEFQTARRRAEEKARQDRKFATERLLRDLLPVLDNFDRTLVHLLRGVDPAKMVEGIEAVRRQLLTALASEGLEAVAANGRQFDPELHEAIAMEPSDRPSGEVLETLETGYVLHERLIRPARVRVSA